MTGARLPRSSLVVAIFQQKSAGFHPGKMIRELDSRNLYLFICFPTSVTVSLSSRALYHVRKVPLTPRITLDRVNLSKMASSRQSR